MKNNIQRIMAGAYAILMAGSAGFAAEPPKNIISMDEARATALKKYPGTIKDSELEREKGTWVYSFDIVGSDKKLHEVWIDAKSGKFLKHKIESAKEEATEQRVEHENNP